MKHALNMHSLSVTLLALCLHAVGAPSHDNRDDLESKIKSISPWTSTTNYSTHEWAIVLDAARAAQNTSPAAVVQILKRIVSQDKPESVSKGEEERKIALLLRVMFQLPEHASRRQWFVYRGWVGSTSPFSADGTVNLAWPVRWSSNGPLLQASLEATIGPPYRASEEYEFLLARYPLRNLGPSL